MVSLVSFLSDNVLAYVLNIIISANLDVLARAKVEYTTFPGWKTSIKKVSSYEELAENCKKYITFIEETLNLPIEWIGVGPERGNMIRKVA